ncbi:HET-domain-containing protein [Hypomontagnella monticulosa]|nr:HET-domain-containing protein [Hypomontagnella monticulosa]
MGDNSFAYKPLQDGEIRLLRLQWGRRNHCSGGIRHMTTPESVAREDTEDVIECEITNHLLDDSPEYAALSYTWGTDEPSQRIRMNGKDVLIRDNLHFFFQRMLAHIHDDSTKTDGGVETRVNPGLAELATGMYWWIDALCINQSDIPERNAQVAQMRRIYSQSQFIAIWLGPAADDSDLAMEAYQSYQSHGTIPRPQAAGLSEKERKWLDALPRDSLEKLWQRTWWRRVWVWQEATTPHVPIEFWCGAGRVTFDVAYAANSAIGHRQSFPDDDVFPYNNYMYAMRQLCATRAGRSAMINISPLWLLDEATRLAASDPKDRVYALLPIWAELRPENTEGEVETVIPVDYGLDSEEVFRLATVYVLRQSPVRLEILKKCMCNSDGTFRRYSWVVDMSDEMREKPWSLFVDFFARKQVPVPDLDPKLTFSEDMTRMSLHARPLGVVKQMHTGVAQGEDIFTLDPGLWEARYRTWIRVLGRIAYPKFDDRPYVGGGSVSEAVDRLLAFNRIIDGAPIRHWPVLEVANFEFSALPDPQTVLRSGSREFIYGISCLTLIETQDGYLGAALPGVRVGDALVGIPGIPCPMVLRPHENFWRIVGCAYVVGLTDQVSWGPEMEGVEYMIV